MIFSQNSRLLYPNSGVEVVQRLPGVQSLETVHIHDLFSGAASGGVLDMAGRQPDTVNLSGNLWEDVPGANPMEVINHSTLGTLGRSKYLTSWTTGWAMIDTEINPATSDIRFTATIQPYAAYYEHHLWWGGLGTSASEFFSRPRLVCYGQGNLRLMNGGSDVFFISVSPYSTNRTFTVTITNGGQTVQTYWNNGEVDRTDNFTPAGSTGTYVAIALARKDSGYHRWFELKMEV